MCNCMDFKACTNNLPEAEECLCILKSWKVTSVSLVLAPTVWQILAHGRQSWLHSVSHLNGYGFVRSVGLPERFFMYRIVIRLPMIYQPVESGANMWHPHLYETYTRAIIRSMSWASSDEVGNVTHHLLPTFWGDVLVDSKRNGLV